MITKKLRNFISVSLPTYLLLVQGEIARAAHVESGALICDSAQDVANGASGFGFLCLTGIVYRLIKVFITLLIIGLFGIILFGGIKYITSGGDEKAIMEARKTISLGFIGLVIGLAGFYLLNVLVTSVFGLPGFIQFTLPCPTGLAPFCP